MATKKYYAVKVGRETGIFTSWDACKAQVQGYSGAVYKSFATLAEAQEYLTGTGTSKMANTDDLTPDLTQLAEGEMVAYVDGSFLLEHCGIERFEILIEPLFSRVHTAKS